MAANYWTSTHRKFWSFTPEKLADMRDEQDAQFAKLTQQHPYPDRRLMFIFLRDRLLQLGKRLPFRQQCVATALVYMHRYFLTTPIQTVNLYLLASTAFYLASKTEESPHHIRLVASEARQFWPEFVPGDVSRLGEMEFCLISEMRSQLIVWHPYRTLLDLKDNQDLKLTSDELGLAWCIINDSYMTDLPLICPPHLVAIIAIFLAIVFYPFTKGSISRPPMHLDMSLGSDSGSFGTLGGRSGMAGVLGSAMHGLPMNPPSSTANGHRSNGVHQSVGFDPSNAQGSDKAKTLHAFQTSEKFQSTVKFLVESDIDLHQMINCTQEIISLYELWEQYNEKSIKDAVSRWLKSNAFDG
jgi:cyclin-C